jgi:DNA invertase Pin-like site-specific DNA recombinase
MHIGYARVSTSDQNLALQKDALAKAGCKKIFTDVASGATDARKGLSDAVNYVRDGDVLVVWKLDRLGRSLRHLIDTVNELSTRGIAFKSLQEQIDSTTSGGKLIFHVFGALAEFEQDLISERTQAGLHAARTRGRKGGRPSKVTTKKLSMAQKLLSDEKNSVDAVCRTLQISRATLYRHLRKAND